jgi:hypothetical protein
MVISHLPLDPAGVYRPGMAGHSGPDVVAKLQAAVDMALKGDWSGAHEIAQQYEGDELASWVHAIAHRMEGDLDNSRYWYGRCGRRLPEDVPVNAELLEIKAALAKAAGH